MQRFKLFIPLIIFVILAVFFWKGLSLDPSAMPSALIDDPVPNFELPIVKAPSTLVTQDIFKGQVSLLNVWATWCISCRVEHPYLNKLSGEGVAIYGVNYKDDTPAALKWLQEFHDPYQLSIVDADGRLGIDLGVFGAPETYLIDQRGVIRYKHVGIVDERVWSKILKPLYDGLQ